MNITDAGIYQDAFDAVVAGTASDAQCKEVMAVAQQLGVYLGDNAARATSIVSRRDGYLELLPPEKRAVVEAAIGDDKAVRPRIEIEK